MLIKLIHVYLTISTEMISLQSFNLMALLLYLSCGLSVQRLSKICRCFDTGCISSGVSVTWNTM